MRRRDTTSSPDWRAGSWGATRLRGKAAGAPIPCPAVSQLRLDRRPCLTEPEALEILRSHFGLAGELESLPSERDQNFRVVSEGGDAFVLKIANPDEPPHLLALQNELLAFLAGRQIGVGLPRVVPPTAGDDDFVVLGGDEAKHWIRLLTYIPGEVLETVQPRTPPLLESLGEVMGRLDVALADFKRPFTAREGFQWDLARADEVIATHVPHIRDPERRRGVERIRAEFRAAAAPLLPELPRSVIHNDANDCNVLVSPASLEGRRVVGLLDFGDIHENPTICDLAIAAAYGLLGTPDPMSAMISVVRGYHRARPLTEAELEVLFPLVRARLGVSVSVSASRAGRPDSSDSYLSISEAPAWTAMAALDQTHPRLARSLLRGACEFEPCPRHHEVVGWIGSRRSEAGPVVRESLEEAEILDLSVASSAIDDLDRMLDTETFDAGLRRHLEEAGASVGIGRYAEPRLCYASESYERPVGERPERRTVHAGIDIFLPAGSTVLAPLGGCVHSARDNSERLDYGPTVVLEHETGEGGCFYTLYGHLDARTLEELEVGQRVLRGQQIGRLGSLAENGNWPPHLHFQLITDLLDMEGDFPGVAPPSQRDAWLSLSPDPGILLDLPEGSSYRPVLPRRDVVDLRRKHLAPSLRLSYRDPLHVVRGWKQYLIDADGQVYLDCVNNVCHVGHCHPRVVEAARRQMGVLNTNTRYLHEALGRYCQRLTATLPDPLSVCFLVNSGSEANELAFRLARAHTGRDHLIVVEGAYHGNTAAAIAASPYKFDGPGGEGAAPHIHPVALPDDYRGPFRRPDPERGRRYAALLGPAIAEAHRRSAGPAAFISESLISCGGQIEPPPGYLEAAYALVREAGGLCICDEVQVGFGRVGSHFWGFETQGVVPDIVTVGKPMGNGHPMGAVVTTPEIAQSFANGMEYFNTFGGNPVSGAVGLAVLQVISDEGLQGHALEVGSQMRERLLALEARHRAIGDVRGRGLFLGVELVSDRDRRTPHGGIAKYVVERMKDHGILLSTDGSHHNVIKIKPPLVFDRFDATRVAEVMDRVLSEDYVSRICGG